MASQLSKLPSVRKQHLLVEYASLKSTCPPGIYLSLIPGNPSIWHGVYFVRKGPYNSAILRFRIEFPITYPVLLPPCVVFETDIFHPLVTPLTNTHTYSIGKERDGIGSARDDEERLMAGGFCLRSGFPDWFGRGRRWRRVEKSGVGERKGGRPLRAGDGDSQIQKQTSIESRTRALSPSISAISAQSSVISGPPSSALASIRTSARGRDLCIIQVLQYMRSSFEDEIVLDHLPIEAAANPGAWHAWRSYRASTGHILEVPVQDKPTGDAAAIEGSGEETPPAGYQRLAGGTSFARGTRRPGEWSWDGVWEERVRRGIEQSNSDAVLYGNLRGNDELIRFLDLSADMMATTKESLKRSTDVAAAR